MTCPSFEHEIVEAWPDLSNRPDLQGHLRHCEQCALAVRRHAIMANYLEGAQPPQPSVHLAHRIKAAARQQKPRGRKRWRSSPLLLLLAVAFLGTGDFNRSKPLALAKPTAPSVATNLALVDAQMVTEHGSLALSRARAAVEPITQATASTITRVLYEMTGPLLFIDRS